MYGMYCVKVISISSCSKAADGIIPTCAKGNVAVISLMNFGMNLCKSVSRKYLEIDTQLCDNIKILYMLLPLNIEKN
jgi:hypothetical protein